MRLISEILKENKPTSDTKIIRVGSVKLEFSTASNPIEYNSIVKKIRQDIVMIKKGYTALAPLKKYVPRLQKLQDTERDDVFFKVCTLSNFCKSDITTAEFVSLYFDAFPVFNELFNSLDRINSSNTGIILEDGSFEEFEENNSGK